MHPETSSSRHVPVLGYSVSHQVLRFAKAAHAPGACVRFLTCTPVPPTPTLPPHGNLAGLRIIRLRPVRERKAGGDRGPGHTSLSGEVKSGLHLGTGRHWVQRAADGSISCLLSCCQSVVTARCHHAGAQAGRFCSGPGVYTVTHMAQNLLLIRPAVKNRENLSKQVGGKSHAKAPS